ncbi:MAG: class I SAM-dependent methyltransferase [Thermoleophilaceae bacterium]|nr:class I SAM-dependent methyltransferase [Thermoleophilaceae bacterium]
MARGSEMGRFWDERAAENALYFIDNNASYEDTDEERFWAGGRTTLDKFLELSGVDLPAGGVAVEIGCGVGRLTRPLAERTAFVHAVDVSERMLALARDRHAELENVEWIHGDGTSLAGVGDGVADVCISQIVFQHIPDPAITLGYVREIGRVLADGGVAGFQVSNDPKIHAMPFRERMKMKLRRHGPRGQGDAPWLGSAVELDDLRTAAAEGGMDIENVYGEGTQFCLVRTRRLPR